jgi:hypothetical protein
MTTWLGLPTRDDPNTADWIIAIAGVAAAVATAFAAVAAWISAKASASTSREAREALAAAIEPELSLEIGTAVSPDDPKTAYIQVRVTNGSRHPAPDLENVVTYEGGAVHAARELLDPYAEGDDWFVDITEISTSAFKPLDVIVRYSDPRVLARYALSSAARQPQLGTSRPRRRRSAGSSNARVRAPDMPRTDHMTV